MADFGISVALVTPFTPDGAIDHDRLGRHAGSVLSRGARGVTLFGTTGEGASVARDEARAALSALTGAGVAPDRVTLGVMETAVRDAAARIADGHAAGVSQFLLAPPFFFGDPGEDGLFGWYAALLDEAPAAARLIPYNIPQVCGVGVSPDLVDRLVSAFPGRIAAVKDSSGDWSNAERLLSRKSAPVLVGDERLLHRAVALGAAGSISGMANLYPSRLARVLETGTEDPALSVATERVVSGPVVPAIKALVARAASDPGWRAVRPPLSPLPDGAREALLAEDLPEAAIA